MATDNPLEKIKTFRLLGGFIKPYRLQGIGMVMAVLISAATFLSLGQILRMLIDEAFINTPSREGSDVIIILGVFILIISAASFFRYLSVHWLGERVVADIRIRVFDHMLKLSPSYYESKQVGNVLSHLSTDTAIVETVLASSLPIALRNILILSGGLVLLIITSPELTLIMAMIVPILIALMLGLGRRVKALSLKTQDKVADLSGHVEEALNGITTLQSFNAETRSLQEFISKVEASFSSARARIITRSFLSASIILLVFGGIAVMIWMGSQKVISGELSGGDMASFVFYAVVVAASVGALSDVTGELERASGAIQRVFELLQVKSDITDPDQPFETTTKTQGKIEFENISFSYPSKPETLALENLSFQAKPGEVIALVGASGAGKTTVFNLLERFYKPQSGRILIDGHDIWKMRLSDSRGVIALVAQDPYIFSATVAENIAFGRPSATETEIIAVAKAASAHEFIESLKDGYNTFVGQKGVRLSGGQKQRLAIARALLVNPEILLLDEATNALDSKNEADIQKALQRLMKGRTTLVIAHRLNTIRNADKIIVLEKGRKVEEGTHAELLIKSGTYARLLEQQTQEKAA